MAIKRVDPNARKKVVSVTDSAIDVEQSDLVKYGETLDTNCLVFKKDEKPTFFVIKNITAENFAEINDKHYSITAPQKKEDKAKVEIVDRSLMLVKYFKFGVEGIEDDGVVVPFTDVATFPPLVISEIGSYVMLISTLGDDLKKK